jgi:SAM-dependent methyltransferase
MPDGVQTALQSALGASAAFLCVVCYSFGAARLRRGAPFVPTAQRKVDATFGPNGLLRQHLPIGKSRSASHLVDLGSGGGTLIRAAVRSGGFGRATGYEINPALVMFSRLRSALSESEHFRLQCVASIEHAPPFSADADHSATVGRSLWQADLTDVDVVLLYAVPSVMDELELKLTQELRPGSLVVSNSFTLPIRKPKLGAATLSRVDVRWVDVGRWSMDDSSAMHVYRVSEVHDGTK